MIIKEILILMNIFYNFCLYYYTYIDHSFIVKEKAAV